MTIEFLDEYEGSLPNLPKAYGRICCICGNSKTYIYKGTPIWARYKDEKNRDTGEWTCHNCQGKKKGSKYSTEIKCRLCGSDKTRIQSNNRSLWIKDIDIKKEWTGKFLCYDCNYPKKKICYECGKSNVQLYKQYDSNGYWTGKSLCYSCHIGNDTIYCNLCNKKIYKRPKNYEGKKEKNVCSGCYGKRNFNRNFNIHEIDFITEKLVAKFLGIGSFSQNIFDRGYDFWHPDFERIQSRGAIFKNNGWKFNIYKNIKCDFFFCIGYDKDNKNVKIVYIIPNEEYISDKISLYISVDDDAYDKFKENEKPWNDIFHIMDINIK